VYMIKIYKIYVQDRVKVLKKNLFLKGKKKI
jgi:hypothetical protein